MPFSPGPAAILWTGGKDSVLAFHEARRAGYEIRLLATFAPTGRGFLAHPLSVMVAQAASLGLPHRIIPIVSLQTHGADDYAPSYEAELRSLREEGIETVITGDIAPINGHPNWISERCLALRRGGFAAPVAHHPLWGRDREELLRTLLAAGFRIRFSYVKPPWFTPDWEGRPLDAAAVEALQALRANGIARGLPPLDLCGEQGEYHTIVTDGPGFAHPVAYPGHA